MSEGISIGDSAPPFSLPDTGGETHDFGAGSRRGYRDRRLLDLQPLPLRAGLA